MIRGGPSRVFCQCRRNQVEWMGSSAGPARRDERLFQIADFCSTTQSTKLTFDVIQTNDRRQQFFDSVSWSCGVGCYSTGITLWLVSLSDCLHQDGFWINLFTVCVFELIGKGNFQFVGVHSSAVQGMGEAIGEFSNRCQCQLDIVIGSSRWSTGSHSYHFSFQHFCPFVELVCLLATGHFRRRRTTFQHCHDLFIDHGFVCHCQIQRRHSIIVLQVQGIRIGINQ
mmetsp:Transcript_16223/g.30101  ORF Transcript_16223/g.30101 Transcript_16223/m.30101 type:complete len:226 (-) Transcript_16223:413-1090(-)